MTRPPQWRVTSALGLVQILTWGSTFYLMAVIAEPMARETSWPREAIAAGLSVALLVSGLAARVVGPAIQRHGGRVVFMGGLCLLTIGLGVLGVAQSLPVYYAAWLVLGVAMAACLYDAAFATLGVLFGQQARPAITAVTLWGGLASTICWPITALLVDVASWRVAVLFYAALHLTITLPLCAFGLPSHRPPVARADRALSSGPPLMNPTFLLLAATGISLSLVFAMVSVHLIPLLTASGFALATAVGLAALIGPAQVAARLIEAAGRGRHPATLTLMFATSLVCLGMAGVWLGLPAAVALVLYGAGTGAYSIARGTVPLALFGDAPYPRVIARLATPVLLAAAAAPVLGAFLIDTVGTQATLGCLTLLSGVALVCALLLVQRARTHPFH